MAEARSHNEPTMEEILASIRRIIVEEDGSPLSANSAAASYEGAVRTIDEVAPAPSAATWPPPVQEAILDVAEPRRNDPLPDTIQPPPTRPRLARFGHRTPPLKPAGAEPPTFTDAAVSASVASLTRVASLSHAARQPELPLGTAGRTLEDMVRELMRPHLKEWLDAHLPRLVERVVRDEIGRLVRDIQDR
jgi:hypothetical protein